MSYKSFKEIYEARKNPELNPKISVYEALKPYSNDPNIFISFTEIDKLGINPHSTHLTPLGIYTYPLKEIWDYYTIDRLKSFSSLPYASREPYIFVLKLTDSNLVANDLKYASSDFDRVESILRNIYNVSTSSKIISWNKFRDLVFKQISYINPIKALWEITRIMSLILVKPLDKDQEVNDDLMKEIFFHESGNIKTITKWNSILQKCGYAGVLNRSGSGFIHPNEPIQAVFLNKSVLTVVDKILNKDYKDKMSISTLNDINEIIIDSNKTLITNLLYFLKGGKIENSEVVVKKSNTDIINNAEFDDVKTLFFNVIRFIKQYKIDNTRQYYDLCLWIKKNYNASVGISESQNALLNSIIKRILEI